MPSILKEIGQFIKAVVWQLWGLMSCALWTLAAIWGAAFGKSNDWFVKLSFFLGLFLLLIAMFQAWKKEYKAKNEFLKPTFDLQVVPQLTLQRDQNAWDAWHSRIAVTNNHSDVALQDCRLVLESWTFNSLGLNQDTPFPVKDEEERQTTIAAKDTKQFDIFYNVLAKGTDQLSYIRVAAPNFPFVSTQVGPYSMIFRLTGNLHTRRYRALLIFDPTQGMRITRIDRID